MLKVALLTDDLTSISVAASCKVMRLTPKNKYWVFKLFKPDFILVESAWLGHKNQWKYKIASYPEHPTRHNQDLVELLDLAKKCGIPAVFWNKEDGVHFERFIQSAQLFDYILTVDQNCIAKYSAIVASTTKVGVLPFAFQPQFHYASAQPARYQRSLFMGSYAHHEHAARRDWQTEVFQVADQYGLTIIDRHSANKKAHYRFPTLPHTQVLPAVPYAQTGKIYQQYSHCLNVNTIIDSPTMFSRRLLEIMACERLAVSNTSLAIQQQFVGMCEVVENAAQAHALLSQLKSGYTKQQKEMIKYAASHVRNNYSYDVWLKKIVQFIEN